MTSVRARHPVSSASRKRTHLSAAANDETDDDDDGYDKPELAEPHEEEDLEAGETRFAFARMTLDNNVEDRPATCEFPTAGTVNANKKKKKAPSKPGGAASEYYRVARSAVDAFLRSSVPADRDAALTKFLTPLQSANGTRTSLRPSQILFRRIIPLTNDEISSIWTWLQKSEEWRKARFPRKTGSQGGSIIDWNPYCNPKKLVYRNMYGDFIENEATEHGNAYEKPAGQVYVELLQRVLNRLYVEQESHKTGELIFRGQTFSLQWCEQRQQYRPVRARMWHLGMVVDPFNHWRGVSIDGLVTINDQPAIVVEIKCPFGADKSLYINEPMYYFTQGQDNLYTMMRYCPTLQSCDRVTYSPNFGINVDTYTLDPSWYLYWYAPRELRHYFNESMKLLTENALFHFFLHHTEDEFNPRTFLRFVSEHFALPLSSTTSAPSHGGPEAITRDIHEAAQLDAKTSQVNRPPPPSPTVAEKAARIVQAHSLVADKAKYTTPVRLPIAAPRTTSVGAQMATSTTIGAIRRSNQTPSKTIS